MNILIKQQSVLQKENEPKWLFNLRKKNFDAFITSKINKDNWKYHNLKNVLKDKFELATPTKNSLNPNLVNKFIDKQNSAAELVFVDGILSEELSDVTQLPKEVLFCSINSAINNHNVLQNLLKQDPNEFLSPFANLNLAFFSDGYFLNVAEGVKVKKPVNILFISSKFLENKNCNILNCINAEKNSEITIIEKYISLVKTSHRTNILTKFNTDNAAKISYFKIQNESENAVHISNTEVFPGKESLVKTHHFQSSALLSREAIYVALKNSSSHFEANGLGVINKKQTSDYHIRIDHLSKQSISNVLYKNVLNDSSLGIFNGCIYVDKSADNTTAHLTNKNLLLAETATMNTSPELEIYNENLICTHGATCGQIDKDALFYLRSRGISEPEAKKLLIDGFIQEILEAFPESCTS